MAKVLTDDEVRKTEDDFTTWAKDRGLGFGDELLQVVHMLLLSSGDARDDLINYLRTEADLVRAKETA